MDVASAIGARLGLDVSPTTSAPALSDFTYTAWIALVMLAVRLVCERIFIPLIASAIKDPSKKKKAADIFDDAFIACASAVLEAQAVASTLYFNGGCTPWSTDPCLVGWPDHGVNIFQRLYFIFMFQYYLYEMLGTALGMGTILKTDMVVHHMATMCLITLGYTTNMLRYGTMWMALFDLSNPLLHIAKVMHAAQIPLLKDVMLPLFALVFFVCRLVFPPFSILYPAFTQSIYILPMSMAATFIALMIFVCVLQVFWFYKIIQIATRGDKSDTKAKEA